MDQELLDALSIVRNMAYEFQDQGRVLHDLVDDDEDKAATANAYYKQDAAIDIVDKFLISQKLGR